jgi:hypothetical protein
MTVSRNAVSQFLSTPRKTALRRWAFQIHFYTGIAMAGASYDHTALTDFLPPAGML